ncbi:MAG: tetratricopeptide repeat protein [Sphingobacteriales bacterium]
MGHLASGLWAMGRYQDAIYLEGKICSVDQADPDNISNYAAFLTMAGVEPLAIPMLRVLNTMYPRNSTILNNMGQAWFGLGDFAMSTRYLDSAIRFFPGHAQANFTKSQIEERKDNKEAATEAMKKSLDNAYSTEKETRLRKLGYPVDKNDVSWPLHIPQDPLGLHKFVLPAFPRDVLESVTLMETWDDFKKRLRSELNALKEKRYRLEAANAEYHGKQIEQSMKAVKTGAPIQSQGPLSLRAQQKLTYIMNDKDGGLSYQWKKAEEDYVNKGKLLRPIFAEREEKSKQIEKKFECLFGEGQCKYTMKDYCTAVDQMNTEYLASANGVEERSVNAMLDILRKWINTQAYYQQYYYPETQFEVAKVDYQILWLGILESVKPQFLLPHPECYKDKQPFKPSTLQEFDDVACNYHSTLEFKGFSIQTDCSRMTTKFSGGPIDFEMKEDLVKNEIMRGSLEVSAGKSADIEKGPVKAEVKGSVAGRVEFDNRGVTDVIVKVEAEVEVGISSLTEGPVKLSGTGERTVVVAGVEGRMGWNSGSSVSGKGILQGVQIK